MPTSRNLVPLLVSALALGLLLLATGVRESNAYDSYSNGSTTVKCAQCHESTPFGGFQGRGPLHDAHNASATATCTRCHVQQGDVPATFRCSGCHGQATSGGAGLRKHHLLAGAPPDNSGFLCSDCHTSDPAPDPESSLPPYYGQADVLQTSPCNADGKEDFWSRTSGAPDGKGLDNDGDLLVDAQDPDCAQPTCVDQDGDGYGNPGHASCSNGPAQDCNDQSTAVHPGAAEIYDLLDNDCNGEADEIKNVLFADTANRNRVSWSTQSPAGQVYDVIRSDGAQFPAASTNSLCVINNTAATAADDLVLPVQGRAFFYLVRNTLVGNYGKSSNGALRVINLCP